MNPSTGIPKRTCEGVRCGRTYKKARSNFGLQVHDPQLGQNFVPYAHCLVPLEDDTHPEQCVPWATALFGCCKDSKDRDDMRNTHQAFRQYKKVYFDTINLHWVVDASSYKTSATPTPLPLWVGGLPVYLTGQNEFASATSCYEDRFAVHPLKVATDSEVLSVANAFPEAIGIRVLKAGHVVVLYENQQMLDALHSTNLPSRLGGMTYSFGVLERRPSSGGGLGDFSKDFAHGAQVAAVPGAHNAFGVIGLRIRLPGASQDCWTTTTHAWVGLPESPRNPMRRAKVVATNLLANLLMKIRHSRYYSTQPPTPTHQVSAAEKR